MAKGSARRTKNAQPVPAQPLVVSPLLGVSDSSDSEDISNISEMHPEGSYGVSASRPGSPTQLQFKAEELETTDIITCQWGDCGVVFTHLPTLIAHIHNDHIGVHKSNYTCEWTSCLRKGRPQTSRFALTSHIRSHTGEKPFICRLPECDKSFTRSDALAKHMRLQHNISPPAPGRGGSRKRKRDDQGTSTPVACAVMASSAFLPNESSFNTFKVEPHTPSEHVDGAGKDGNHVHSRSETGANGRQRRPARPSQLQSQHTPPSLDGQGDEEEDGYTSSASDILPPHLQEKMNEGTGLIMGHTPAKVKYLVMKAKHQYALQQHELLLERLRETKLEMRKEKGEKEHALDDLLRRMLGPDADILMPLPIPPGFAAPPALPNTALAHPSAAMSYLPVPPAIQNGNTSRTKGK